MPNARTRRTKNYWEPFYNTNENNDFPNSDWNFSHCTGFRYQTFSAEKLKGSLEGKNIKLIQGVTFTTCDFYGEFEDIKLIFKNCTFRSVDFGLTTLVKAKFTKCSFESVFFSQCSLINSEFRDCKFTNIYASGNETELNDTIITNPYNFLDAVQTNLSNLPDGISKQKQKSHIEKTKNIIARILVNNLSKEGSTASYYEAIKYSTLQEFKENKQFCWLKIVDYNSKFSKDFLGIIIINIFLIISFTITTITLKTISGK